MAEGSGWWRRGVLTCTRRSGEALSAQIGSMGSKELTSQSCHPAEADASPLRRRQRLMAEGARAREHHRYAVFVANLDGLFVSVAAAGLDDRGDAGLAGVFDGIAARKGEECVRGKHRARDP